MRHCRFALFLLIPLTMRAQPPAPATMKQLMVDLIHPASNALLLAIYRGGPKDDAEWAAVRHNALLLTESGTALTTRGPRTGDWAKDAQMLSDAGAASYKAALVKDAKALSATATSIDQACTTCHKQFRPNVFPGAGGSK